MRALPLVALAVGVAIPPNTVGYTSQERQCSQLAEEAVEQGSMEAFDGFARQCVSEDDEKTAASLAPLMGQIGFSFIDADTKQPVSFPANLLWIHGDATEEEIAWRKKHLEGLEIVDQGAGKFLITNVLPGEYAVFATVPDYGYKNVAKVDVPPAGIVELGEIEVAVNTQ